MQTSGSPCGERRVVSSVHSRDLQERFRSGELELLGLTQRLPAGRMVMILHDSINKCYAKIFFGGA